MAAQKQTTEKKEFNMNQLFAMWINKSKAGKNYLSGKDSDGRKLIGFFNGKKQNPKEPDVRIYEVLDNGEVSKNEFTSLWVNVSANGKKYLSGKIGEHRVVGFINSKATVDGKVPYFSIYESDSEPKKEEKKQEAADPVNFVNVPEGEQEVLPF